MVHDDDDSLGLSKIPPIDPFLAPVAPSGESIQDAIIKQARAFPNLDAYAIRDRLKRKEQLDVPISVVDSVLREYKLRSTNLPPL